jgi:hypothetical protein
VIQWPYESDLPPKSDSGLNIFLILAACFATGFIQGCHPSGRDKNGRYAEAVADTFVKAVNAGDFQAARACWEPNSIRYFELNRLTSFDAFWKNAVTCDRHELSKPVEQKAGYYSIVFRGTTQAGDIKRSEFYLRKVNGEWLFGTDLWRSEGR